MNAPWSIVVNSMINGGFLVFPCTISELLKFINSTIVCQNEDIVFNIRVLSPFWVSSDSDHAVSLGVLSFLEPNICRVKWVAAWALENIMLFLVGGPCIRHVKKSCSSWRWKVNRSSYKLSMGLHVVCLYYSSLVCTSLCIV